MVIFLLYLCSRYMFHFIWKWVVESHQCNTDSYSCLDREGKMLKVLHSFLFCVINAMEAKKKIKLPLVGFDPLSFPFCIGVGHRLLPTSGNNSEWWYCNTAMILSPPYINNIICTCIIPSLLQENSFCWATRFIQY